jgi:8-oxo-dGTP diphosphatase
MGLTRERLTQRAWKPVATISKGSLPFDHHAILDTALTRLRGKLRYTNIAKAFLAETFRIEELQEVYEAILGRELNRTNFRNKLLKIRLIERVRILSDAVGKQGGRPPHLYRFTQTLIEAVDRDFL